MHQFRPLITNGKPSMNLVMQINTSKLEEGLEKQVCECHEGERSVLVHLRPKYLDSHIVEKDKFHLDLVIAVIHGTIHVRVLNIFLC